MEITLGDVPDGYASVVLVRCLDDDASRVVYYPAGESFVVDGIDDCPSGFVVQVAHESFTGGVVASRTSEVWGSWRGQVVPLADLPSLDPALAWDDEEAVYAGELVEEPAMAQAVAEGRAQERPGLPLRAAETVQEVAR